MHDHAFIIELDELELLDVQANLVEGVRLDVVGDREYIVEIRQAQQIDCLAAAEEHLHAVAAEQLDRRDRRERLVPVRAR